ncbi:MAG: hypothetical protein JWO22_3545 [Frankiales bacterium]|nr:hypothetical protein [Frankiales bacterium]
MRSALLLASGAVVAVAGATTASAGGNGAARSGLSPTVTDNSQQCDPGTGAGTNGFAIVNAPGKPGEARFVNGEVSLKRGAPSSVYTVWLNDGSTCLPEGTPVTNGVGNGNHHLNDASLSDGTFYVVLKDASGNEAFATAPVTVN